MTQLKALRTAARHQLWREGRPGAFLLDAGQREWKAAFNATGPLASTVWNVGRQRGKTFAALVDACETAVTTPGAILRYCAKTKESALGIVEPNLAIILEDCPPELRPKLDGTTFEFPGDAKLIVFGTDAQSFAKGRGPRTHKQYLDECGFYQDLLSVESALMPSLQTTGGRALYLSTPAESLGHPYTTRIRGAMASGNYRHDTFWSNPRVDHEAVIREEASRRGETREQFLASTYFRREFLAELVTEESRAAFPAWTLALAGELVGDWERPEHFDAYQAHDPGKTGDPHGSLFGWHDPATAGIVIESELELRSAAHTVKAWADEVKRVESTLYGAKRWDGTLLGAGDWRRDVGELPEYLQRSVSEGAPRQPYLRTGDNDGLVLATLNIEQGLAVIPTPRHDKHLAVDAVNQLFVQRRIRIHRRCVRLIEQLHTTIWTKTRSEWERTDKDHGDLVDCLVYLARNVRWHRDCRPRHVDSAARAVAEAQRRVMPQAGWAKAFR